MLALFTTLVLSAACASGSSLPSSSGERVLAVSEDGRVIRQSTADENSRTTFAAPVDRVWPALAQSYYDLGIQHTVADRAAGRFGNAGFIVPKRMLGRPVGDFFRCGDGLTGPLVDAGRVVASAVTQLSPGDAGTIAFTRVTGSLRRNDGTSTEPVLCSSTGVLEEHLRTATTKRLAGAP
jgi:hypothetical protein